MVSDTPWSKQRDASDRVTKELLRLLEREFDYAVVDAWMDFNQDDDPIPLSDMPQELSIFSPYLLFEWRDGRKHRWNPEKPLGGIVVETYLQKSASRLSLLERQILEQAIVRPVSFYEIVSVQRGQSAVLRDILIGEEIEIEEHSGTTTMRPGDIMYAQIWILPEVATLGRTGPVIITPDRKLEIIKLRAKLQRKIKKQNRDLTASDLVHYKEEIRTVYLNIRDAMSAPPKLLNTDGEPFLSHKIHFKIASAQEAFDALAPLAWGWEKEDLLEEAEHNPDGSLQNIEFSWAKKGNKMHKSWDNTILGHIKIQDKSLVVEVNSVNRAQRIKDEIEQRLGAHATHTGTTTETPEQMLKQAKQRGALRGGEKKPEVEDLLRDPEVRRKIEAEMQKQFEGWVQTKIPALGGRTPMQAVRDPDGKEMVIALLDGWERKTQGPEREGLIRPDVNAMRRLLNLPLKSAAPEP